MSATRHIMLKGDALSELTVTEQEDLKALVKKKLAHVTARNPADHNIGPLTYNGLHVHCLYGGVTYVAGYAHENFIVYVDHEPRC